MNNMLSIENSVLVIIDIQGNLAHVMDDKLFLFENVQKIIKGAQIFAIPIIVTEQTPDKLGSTIHEVSHLLPDIKAIGKNSFSCCKNIFFKERLNDLNRDQILLTGIEAHICVYQTAVELISSGYEVHAIVDCVSSRTAKNREIGIWKMHDCGADITSVETVLFELLQTAGDERFKEIYKIVK